MRRTAGRPTPLVDGIEKVTGRARYTADLDGAETLVARILRSPHAHAEIVAIDVSAAARYPGVKAVVTGADCDKTYGVLPIAMNEYPLARERVRYRGEPVAAIAAVDAATAETALALIRVEYRVLPAVFTAAEARAPGAPPLHPDRPDNVVREVHHVFGDVDAGFAAAGSCARSAFIAPRSTTRRWSRTPRARAGTRSGSASPSGASPRCPTTCT